MKRVVRPSKRKPVGTIRKGMVINPDGHNGMPATLTERQKFREAFHVALDATPAAIRKLVYWMNHGETFGQQFQAVDRILALVEKVCVRQGVDLNIIADVKMTEIVALNTDDLDTLADKWAQMIGAQETAHRLGAPDARRHAAPERRVQVE